MKSSMFLIATVFSAVFSLSPNSASAQDKPESIMGMDRDTLCSYLDKNERIKVEIEPGSQSDSATGTDTSRTLTGNLRSCEDGILTFWQDGPNGGLTQVPLDGVQTMHFSTGERKGHTLAGAGVGLAVGILIALTNTQNESDNTLDGVAVELAQETTNVLAIIGMPILGAGIGAMIRTEKWTKVWDKNSLITSVGSRNGQYVVALEISF